MFLAVAHPLQSQAPALNVFSKGLSGGFFDDVFEFISNGVQGLYNAAEAAINSVVQIIVNVVKVVVEVVLAAVGVISWSQVAETLGTIAREIGNVLVVTNPARIALDVLKGSRLTAHSFNELDKFTGGMLTTSVNVGDVVFRGMRGDPISKQELLQNALFILQVASVILAGPAGMAVVGGIVGGMVGREVCKHQSDAKDACNAAFQIVGMVAGGWAGAATGATWTSPLSTSALAPSATTVAAGSAGAAIATQGFTTVLTNTTVAILNQRITQEATRAMIAACQNNRLAGDRECQIVANILARYANTPDDVEWTEFLAQEAAQLGVALVLETAFPKNSPESMAITNYLMVTPNVPPQAATLQEVVLPQPKPRTGLFIALAAGAGLLLVGGLA